MDYPIRQNIEFPIIHGKNGKKRLVLTCLEGTLEQLVEYLQAEDKIDWLCSFFQEQIPPIALKTILSKNLDVVNTIVSGIFQDCFKQGKSESAKTIFASTVCLIAEKCNIPPHILFKEYTYRQLEFIIDGLVWNMNEQTKEGQFKNKQKLGKKKIEKFDRSIFDTF